MFAFGNGCEVAGCGFGERWVAGLVVTLDHGEILDVFNDIDLGGAKGTKEDMVRRRD